MSEHVIEHLAVQIARHRYDNGFTGVPWEVIPDATKRGLQELASEFLSDAIPVLLAAGWMPPREVHSAANDLTGLVARVYSDELHEDKHTPAPARDGATMVICDECDVRWPCDKAVPGTFGYTVECNPIDGFLQSKHALDAIRRYLTGTHDAHRGGDCE